MEVSVVGGGAVGARVARQLLSTAAVDEVVIRDSDPMVAEAVARSLGGRARVDRSRRLQPTDLVVLATPVGHHLNLAERAVDAGVPVVSVTDGVRDVERLLELDRRATSAGVSVVVGAGLMPGLSGVLVAHAAEQLDEVEEIHLAKLGTGGPACAVQHHRALRSATVDWRDGAWVRRPGGSGRELCWFPSPVDAHDCYRAALPDTQLLHAAFPEAQRITSRVSATRRDRLTMHLPMLRRPHPEGRVGAVRVELRGTVGSAYETVVYGAVKPPAVAAGAVAALCARWILEGRIDRAGAGALATFVDAGAFLAALARLGVTTEVFEGTVSSG